MMGHPHSAAVAYASKVEKLQEEKQMEIEALLEAYADLTEEERNALLWHFVFKQNHAFPRLERSDVVGMDYVLDQLDEIGELMKVFSVDDENQPVLPKGVLISGSPGCGKTYVSAWFGNRANARIVPVTTAPRLKGEPIPIRQIIRLANEYARAKGPIVIFFDEIDAYTSGDSDARAEFVAECRQAIDGIEGQTNGVFIVAASNKPSVIPADLLREGRIEARINISEPIQKAKIELLTYYLSKYKSQDTSIDTASLVYLMKKQTTPAAIRHVIEKAARRADLRRLKNKDAPDSGISQDDLIQILLRELRGAPKDFEFEEDEWDYHARIAAVRGLTARTYKFPTQLIALSKRGYTNAHVIAEYESEGRPTAHSRLVQRITVELSVLAAQEMFGYEPDLYSSKAIGAATGWAEELIEGHGLRIDEDGALTLHPLSLASLAAGRDSKKISGVFSVTPEQHENTQQILTLIQRQLATARSVIAAYGEEHVLEMARALQEREYLTQEDLDSFADPGIAQNAKPEEQTRVSVGFSA